MMAHVSTGVFQKDNKVHRDKNKLPNMMDVHNVELLKLELKQVGGSWIKSWNLYGNCSTTPQLKNIKLKRSDHIPSVFCQSTWVKDEHVASCAIDVWQFIVTFVTDGHCLILIAQKIINHVIY